MIIVLPSSLPMKASKSPSLSRSAKTGEAALSTLSRLNGLLEDVAKAGTVGEPVFWK